jgi:hypothetical protein
MYVGTNFTPENGSSSETLYPPIGPYGMITQKTTIRINLLPEILILALKYKCRYAQITMRHGVQTVKCTRCDVGVTEGWMDAEEKNTNMSTLSTMESAVICL